MDRSESQDLTACVAEPTGGLGSRAHVRETIARARAAIAASREHTASSRALLVRAGLLAQASDRALQQSLVVRAELRASVTAYVQHLKADGLPAERMLILVKSAVHDAATPSLDPADLRTLVEDVVRWSVDAFYQAA